MLTERHRAAYLVRYGPRFESRIEITNYLWAFDRRANIDW